MTPKIKAVIFDLGGTLIQQTKTTYELLNKKYPLTVSQKEYQQLFRELFNKQNHKNLEKPIKKFSQQIGNNKAITEEIRKLFTYEAKRFKKFSDTEPILKELQKNGYRLAILSNWHQHCLGTISAHGLSSYFEIITVSAHEGTSKPDPTIFNTLLKKLHVKPHETLMVGNSYTSDYLPAKALGMHALFLERDTKTYPHSIKSLKQVKTYIKKVNGKF